jgi:sterol 3beta-glucosyltransferase
VLPSLDAADSALQQWIDANDAAPPIYIGWGSMSLGATNAKPLTDVVVEALMRTGKRGVVLRGWSRLGAEHLTDAALIEYARTNVFFADNVLHADLLPQCEAILVHGGAGTTQAALIAGKPIMVSPFTADQPFFGRLVEQHGVGFGIEPFAHVSVDGLSEAIVHATTDEALKQRAAKLGARLQLEDGGHATAQIIASVSTQHMRFEHLGQVEQRRRDEPSAFSPSRALEQSPPSSSACRQFEHQTGVSFTE